MNARSERRSQAESGGGGRRRFPPNHRKVRVSLRLPAIAHVHTATPVALSASAVSPRALPSFSSAIAVACALSSSAMEMCEDFSS